MDQYIGLDVSLKDTAVSIRENRKRIWRGKCPSDPKVISQIIRKHAPHAKLVVFETGPLSTWFYHALNAERIPAICIEARHAQKVLGPVDKVDSQISGSVIQDCFLGGSFGSWRPDGYGMADHRRAFAQRTWQEVSAIAR